MKWILKLEHFALFLLFSYLLVEVDGWNYLVFLFLPDLSMIGYVINPRIGSYAYNFVHNQVLAVIILFPVVLAMFTPDFVDVTSDEPLRFLLIAGLVLLTHINMDRMLGYGLKYPDKFKHTHLDSKE